VGNNFPAIAEVTSTELSIPLPTTVLDWDLTANSSWAMVAQCYAQGSAFEENLLKRTLTFYIFPPWQCLMHIEPGLYSTVAQFVSVLQH